MPRLATEHIKGSAINSQANIQAIPLTHAKLGRPIYPTLSCNQHGPKPSATGRHAGAGRLPLTRVPSASRADLEGAHRRHEREILPGKTVQVLMRQVLTQGTSRTLAQPGSLAPGDKDRGSEESGWTTLLLAHRGLRAVPGAQSHVSHVAALVRGAFAVFGLAVAVQPSMHRCTCSHLLAGYMTVCAASATVTPSWQAKKTGVQRSVKHRAMKAQRQVEQQ